MPVRRLIYWGFLSLPNRRAAARKAVATTLVWAASRQAAGQAREYVAELGIRGEAAHARECSTPSYPLGRFSGVLVGTASLGAPHPERRRELVEAAMAEVHPSLRRKESVLSSEMGGSRPDIGARRTVGCRGGDSCHFG